MTIDTDTIWLPELSEWPGPRYQAIASAISADIETGTLPPGTRLPTQRQLAQRLGVTVGTVSRGYMLADERGLVSCEIGRGTFVRDPSADGAAVMAESNEAGVADLSVNMPIGSANGDALAAALAGISRAPGIDNLLRYMPPEGHADHRAAAAKWTARSGLLADPRRVVLTQGAQQGLASIFDVLASPGDTVLVESLTYPGLITNAKLKGVSLGAVDLDDEGMIPDDLERKLEETRARVVALVPTIHNPTAAVMSEPRRAAIAAIARKHEIIVIEDDVYGYLPTERPLPIAALLPEQTVYVTGASKCLAPGLRVGWLVAPERLVGRFADAVYTRSVAQPALNHEIFKRWVDERVADSLLERLRLDTAERQAIAARSLSGFHVKGHPASFHLLLTLPKPWRRDEFIAAAADENILVTSISSFAVDLSSLPEAVRISVASIRSQRLLDAALRRIRQLLVAGPSARHKVV